MRALGRDLRFALRVLWKSPAYAAVSVLTLALAIGVNTAIFSVVNGVLLRDLPYREPDRLVTIWEKAPQFPEMSISYLDFLDWVKGQRSFEALGALRGESYNLTGAGRPERLQVRMVSASFFPLLGVTPQLGRAFLPEEDRGQGTPVALLTHAFWQRHFAGDPGVVGRTFTLDGRPFTVVGVLPRSLRPVSRWGSFPLGDVYVPLALIPERLRLRGNHPGIFGVGRLAPGVTFEQARTDLEGIGRALGAQYDSNRSVLPALAPMHLDMVERVKPTLLVLMAAVVFVLLIAVANVANLMLARGTTRRKEMAVRAALGAGRWQIARQLLIESTITAVVGGAAGVLLALWGVDVLSSARPDSLPLVADIRIDRSVLAFSLVVSVGTGILFGMAPALQAARASLHDALKDGNRTTAGRGHRRLRGSLVVTEVALALVLLVGAGLLLRTVVSLQSVDLGFRPDGLLTAGLSLPPGKYDDVARLRAFLGRVSDNVRAIPGVKAASVSAGLPLAGASETSFWIEGRPRPAASEIPFAVYYPVSVGYREAMGITLVAGRWFTEADGPTVARVGIIDDVLARRFFPQGALGKRLTNVNGENPIEIVGVVKHVVHYGVGEREAAPYQLHFPYLQIPEQVFARTLSNVAVVVRAEELAPDALRAGLTSAVANADPDQPIYDVRTMGSYVHESLAGRRFTLFLLGLFAALALVLAATGLYAVMAYTVSQRTPEIGVRMALGAQSGDVQRMMVGQGIRLAGIGLLLGLALGLAVTRAMRGMIVGVAPTDPLTFGAVAGLLAMVALLASWLPARRATRIDPMIALRRE
jgi:predicted permease